MGFLAPFLKTVFDWFLAFVLKRFAELVKDYFNKKQIKKEEQKKQNQKVEELKKEYQEAVKSGDEQAQKDAYKKLFGK